MAEDAPAIPQAGGAPADVESGSMGFQAKGNDFFKAGKYADAIDMYTRALEQEPVAAVYCNRAFCHIKLENFGSAILDAGETLKIDPRCVRTRACAPRACAWRPRRSPLSHFRRACPMRRSAAKYSGSTDN